MTQEKSNKPLAITPGDPAGIGPDICLMLSRQHDLPEYLIIADADMLKQRAKILDIDSRALPILHVPLRKPCQPGKASIANAEYVLETLNIATKGCLEGQFAGLVTGPVNKAVINEAGISFTGHTEYLAKLTDTEQVVMMLAAKTTRIALVTTHVPLKDVAKSITSSLLENVLKILHHDLLNRLAIKNPCILISGLNPHAGENGYLGDEEITVIKPAIDKLRSQGMDLQGPLSADTLFIEKNLKLADAILVMYHDQGLPIIKHIGFGNAVNITLGLPIIRTSVDHGTAFELAGTGKADANSLVAAIRTANELTK